MLEIALAVGVMAGVQFLFTRLRRRHSAATLRTRYSARFDDLRERQELDEYVEIVRTALPALRDEPIEMPTGRVLDQAWLAEAIAAGAERFGIPPTKITCRFVSEATAPNAAGCVVRPGRADIRLEGNRAIISPRTDVPDVWAVEVVDRYRFDPEVALVIVGHELAHVALLSRGVRLTPAKRNERLTDVAAALAGFGTLMLRVAGRERLIERHDVIQLSVGAVGYLHRDAIAYLNGRYLGR